MVLLLPPWQFENVTENSKHTGQGIPPRCGRKQHHTKGKGGRRHHRKEGADQRAPPEKGARVAGITTNKEEGEPPLPSVVLPSPPSFSLDQSLSVSCLREPCIGEPVLHGDDTHVALVVFRAKERSSRQTRQRDSIPFFV